MGAFSKFKLRGTIWAGIVLGLCQPVFAADMIDTTVSVSMVSPLQINSASPMEFGVVTIPKAGSCDYALGPDGNLQASGGSDCAALSGTPMPAEFSVSCAADTQVRFDISYTNSAPSGASFGAGTAPMNIDGRGAGGVVQVLPCDTDGLSEVRAGGLLSVTPAVGTDFTGEIGTITLEVIYD